MKKWQARRLVKLFGKKHEKVSFLELLRRLAHGICAEGRCLPLKSKNRRLSDKVRNRLLRLIRGIHRILVGITSISRFYTRRHLRRFGEIVGKVDLVLDVGARTAPYAKYFESNNYLLIDVQKRENISIVGDVCYLPFRSQVADLVILTDVLEHIADSRQALLELNHVLKKNGWLVLTIPLMWGVHDYRDYLRWTEKAITLELSRAGLEVVRVLKRGGIFATMGALLSQVPHQLFVTGGKREGWQMDIASNWWRWMLWGHMYYLLVPITWLLTALDFLDRHKNFTLGYAILCRKRMEK